MLIKWYHHFERFHYANIKYLSVGNPLQMRKLLENIINRFKKQRLLWDVYKLIPLYNGPQDKGGIIQRAGCMIR